MPRILVAVVALFSISGGVYADTPPSPAAAIHTALFTTVNADNHFVRSLVATGTAHSTPAALACCRLHVFAHAQEILNQQYKRGLILVSLLDQRRRNDACLISSQGSTPYGTWADEVAAAG